MNKMFKQSTAYNEVLRRLTHAGFGALTSTLIQLSTACAGATEARSFHPHM